MKSDVIDVLKGATPTTHSLEPGAESNFMSVNNPPSVETTPNDLYDRLKAPFDETFKDNRGGIELEYLTGEQVVSRLNDVLGFENWDFMVEEHGINVEADEVWVKATLSVTVGDSKYPNVSRQQFGSQKLKRSRTDKHIIDLGFDLKGATTDALKKCASLVGVGLYLSKKEPQSPSVDQSEAYRPKPVASETVIGPLICQVCETALEDTRFRDGKIWTAQQLAQTGQKKFNGVFCMTHYKQLKNQAEAA